MIRNGPFSTASKHKMKRCWSLLDLRIIVTLSFSEGIFRQVNVTYYPILSLSLCLDISYNYNELSFKTSSNFNPKSHQRQTINTHTQRKRINTKEFMTTCKLLEFEKKVLMTNKLQNQHNT